jgi:methionyl-tRNA synthetase
MTQRTLVTAALPYANGSIHIGHLVEYLMTDIYVRALRLSGEDALYICADDTHGTPIELNAQKAGVSPEEFVARFAKEHLEDFESFGIRFDSYYSTNSEENRRWAYEIYDRLKAGGYVEKRALEQLYDEKAGRFLPDRFVKGTCPKCGTQDQYGDACESCGSTYEPTDLVNPYSVVSGTKPVLRSSEHLFVSLARFADFLNGWVKSEGRLQPETRKFVEGWLESGLKDWCISRDKPYFGFEIPDHPDKYFYVWLDAPIGYISSTENWARMTGQPHEVDEIWRRKKARIIHVIGKDIVYFHTLFWPAMLYAADLAVPSRVQVHGMLTVDGVKMSKSRGTFVNARTFRQYVDPIYLRYYFASKIGPSAEDVDLALDEFVNRVNAELVNNLANLVSRASRFLFDKLDGRYGKLTPEDKPHLEEVRRRVAAAEQAYQRFDLAEAVKQALEIARLGNGIFQDSAPWTLIKEDRERARDLVTLCLNLARAATVIMAPAVPAFAEKVYPILGLEGAPRSFQEATTFELVERKMGAPDRIVDRITRAQLDQVIEASRQPEAAKPEPPKKPQKRAEPDPAAGKQKAESGAKASPEQTTLIGIEDFSKIDLRVALVLSAELVEGADKLLKLTVDVGEEKPRTVFAGIRSAYTPEQVTGRKVALVYNLQPRKMRFGTSEGMVLAAGPGGKEIWLLSVPDDASPGSRIK